MMKDKITLEDKNQFILHPIEIQSKYLDIWTGSEKQITNTPNPMDIKPQQDIITNSPTLDKDDHKNIENDEKKSNSSDDFKDSLSNDKIVHIRNDLHSNSLWKSLHSMNWNENEILKLDNIHSQIIKVKNDLNNCNHKKFIQEFPKNSFESWNDVQGYFKCKISTNQFKIKTKRKYKSKTTRKC